MVEETPRRTRFLNPHVRTRMAQRGIPEEAIWQVLDNYHTQHPARSQPGVAPTVVFVGEYQGRNLKVYVRRDSNPPYVKTVVWEGDQ